MSPINNLNWYVVVLLPAVLQETYVGPSDKMYPAVIAIAAVALFAVVIGAIITLLFMNTRLIKLTRPLFTFMVLLGCLLLGISCILLLGENTDANCAVRPWIFNLSFTFAFSPLLIKAWRVHVMFNLNPLSKNKLISSITLIGHTLVFVAIDAFILGMTLYVGGKGTKPETTVELSSNGAYAELTYCTYTKNSSFLYTEITYKGLLIAAACYLAFKVRKIAGTIAGSKTLLAIVYNVAFISGVILLICKSVTDIPTIVVCQTAGICFCVVFTVCLLVIPTFWHLATVGDDEAADEVIQEVFDTNKKGASRPVSNNNNS